MQTEKYNESYFSDKTILVTGGAGAIGRALSDKLAKSGAKRVIILDNMASAYQWNIPDKPNITFIKGDIRNESDLLRAFGYRPQIIFHLAAFFANQNSIDNPLENEDVNGVGHIKLLEYARITGSVERFVYTNSEGGAYGVDSKLPYKEEDITFDLGSPYYISKLSGEMYCRYYFRQFGLPVTVVRLFNSYGPGEVPGAYRNVIPNFIFWALSGKPLPLTGSREIARDFVFVDDTVNGIMRAAFFKNAIGQSFNISTGNPRLIYELAELINQKTGNAAGLRILNMRKWDHRPVLIGDPGKAGDILGFKAEFDFLKGIDLTIEWFRQSWDHIVSSVEFAPGTMSALDV